MEPPSTSLGHLRPVTEGQKWIMVLELSSAYGLLRLIKLVRNRLLDKAGLWSNPVGCAYAVRLALFFLFFNLLN